MRSDELPKCIICLGPADNPSAVMCSPCAVQEARNDKGPTLKERKRSSFAARQAKESMKMAGETDD